MASIKQIPPEILSLVPHFWGVDDRDRDVIALTHICQAWRDVFLSCGSLWTDISCRNLEKTRAYLDRSRSSPISLSLNTAAGIDLTDPFFKFIPGVTGRLKSLYLDVVMEELELVNSNLAGHVPLLEVLSIKVRSDRAPVLPPALFNGDLSSLHKLCLMDVRPELPWRNMVNLTSFVLQPHFHSPPVSMVQLLNFFESAPHLREVDIDSRTPVSGIQTGRLVPLACLKRMDVKGHPSSNLFDHLLIPVGACLKMVVDLPDPKIEGHPPKFIDNLKNLSDFTAIGLNCGSAGITFRGPNGEVRMVPHLHMTELVFESLAYFDTSKTERLGIGWIKSPAWNPLYQGLLTMKDLRTLTLSRCQNPRIFTCVFDPSTNSSGVMLCPKLEELFIKHRYAFDIMDVAEMAARRALRGAKLKAIRIDTYGEFAYPRSDVLELEKHISHVELGNYFK